MRPGTGEAPFMGGARGPRDRLLARGAGPRARDSLSLQELQGRPQQRADGHRRARAPVAAIRAPLAELGALAVQQPGRLDGGQFDDLQDHLGGHRHPRLVVVPGPDGDPQAAGHLRTAPLTEQLRAQARETLGQGQLCTHRLRKGFATSHDGIPERGSFS